MRRNESRYWGQVRSLFGFQNEAEAEDESVRSGVKSRPSPHPVAHSAAQPGDEHQDRQEFEQRLRDFASQRDSSDGLVAGKVNLININKIRERMGKRWPRLADRIHGQIKTQLKTRLTRHDFFTQVNADTYVIVFGDCSEVEARLKVALLSEQILEKLFGEAEARDLKVLGVETLVTKADGSVASEALDSTAYLVDLLDQAEVTELDPNTHKFRAAAGERALTPEVISELLGDVDSQLKAYEDAFGGTGAPGVRVDRLRELIRQLKNLEDAIASQDPPLTPKPAQKEQSEPCAWVEFRRPALEAIGCLKSRAERVVAFVYVRQLKETETPSDPEASLSLDFSYLPMWHAPTQKTGIYLCQTVVKAANNDALQSPVDARDVELELLAIIDRLTLRRARQDLHKTFGEHLLNMVVVPIHFSTLQRDGSRHRIVELCSNIPEDLRNLLIWEVLGAHVDTWSLQLPEVIKPVRQFARAVFLRLHEVQEYFPEIRRNLRYLQAAGIHQIGVDVTGLEGSEAESLDLLERLAVEAQTNGLRCYGHGFESLGMTICAVSVGYQHLSGPAIAEPVARPEGIQPTTMESIYSRIVKGKPTVQIQ